MYDESCIYAGMTYQGVPRHKERRNDESLRHMKGLATQKDEPLIEVRPIHPDGIFK